MKKVLFVLGLALCSTFAMAQTNGMSFGLCNSMPTVQKLKVADQQQPVDYKASIFTKTDDVELALFDFDSTEFDANAAEHVVIDVVHTGDMLDGEAVAAAAAHTHTSSTLRWSRIADSAATRDSNGFLENFAGMLEYMPVETLNRYMGVRNGVTEDNGFMCLSLSEVGISSKTVNTYFTLPSVTIPAGVAVADVTWKQYYRRYYDQTFIDYWKDTTWVSYEINVTGIDVEVTGLAPVSATATLPPDAIQQPTLKLRFRLYCEGGNYYGYGWAIDDIRVMAVNTSARWRFVNDGYISGFYGTLPVGFETPLEYAVFGRNTSVDSLYGNKLNVLHRYYADTAYEDWDLVFDVDQDDMPSGDPSANFLWEIDEAGMMAVGLGFGTRTNQYRHTWAEYYPIYGVPDSVVADSGYLRRHLPVAEDGRHQFAISASNTNGLADTLDGKVYTVLEALDADTSYGRTIPGYRWSHDNGIIPGGSEFAYGFTDEDAEGGPGYVTSNCGHQYEPNYMVLTRYNTPSKIPTDANGNPWVIRGIEYVTSTKLTGNRVHGSTIAPLVYRYVYDMNDTVDGSFSYVAEDEFGFDGSYYLIDSNSAPASMAEQVGFTKTEDAYYYCYNVLCPNQPALRPNTSYLIGYANGGGGDFAVARTSNYYLVSQDSMATYRSNPELAPYSNQFTPTNKYFDGYCQDPISPSRSDSTNFTVTAFNIDYYPMIRLIVGPELTIDTFQVYLDCGTTVGDYWITDGRNTVCGTYDTLIQGMGENYYIVPGYEDEMVRDENGYYVIDPESEFIASKVIEHVYLDGNALDLNSNAVSSFPYTMYWLGHTPADEEPWAPALTRYYYGVSIANISHDHTISADVRTAELRIRDIEDNVNLALSPNPATSQVNVKVAGFNGKANCSILDMSGRVVYSTDITAGESVISLNGVSAGAYFVRVTNDTFSKVEKLIVR